MLAEWSCYATSFSPSSNHRPSVNTTALATHIFTRLSKRSIRTNATYLCALSGSLRRFVISCCISESNKISRILLSDKISFTLESSRSAFVVSCSVCLFTWQELDTEISAFSSGGWTSTSLMSDEVELDAGICLSPSELKWSPVKNDHRISKCYNFTLAACTIHPNVG